VGSLALRPGDSLTIPKMALSIGFISFVSSTNTIQATGLLILAPVGLSPTEHASLSWTHSSPKTPSAAKTLVSTSPRLGWLGLDQPNGIRLMRKSSLAFLFSHLR
jgi:hypothetical protein